LYLGLVFLFMVMYAPGGHRQPDHDEPARGLVRQAAALLGVLPGAWLARAMVVRVRAAMIEMVYHLQLNAAAGARAELHGRHAQRQEG
jgi:branched-chain amino acid transport system permease protein